MNTSYITAERYKMIITKNYNVITEGEFLDVFAQTILNQLGHDIEDKNHLQQLYTDCHNDDDFVKRRTELYCDNERHSHLVYTLIRDFDRKYRHDELTYIHAKRMRLFLEDLNREYSLLANQVSYSGALTLTN